MRLSPARLLVLLLITGTGLFLLLAPAQVERSMNRVQPHAPYPLSERAHTLHRQLLVADLHADSTLWQRDLLQRSERGHVDLPRLLEGGVALQVFTAVTRSPAGQNYRENASDALDNITLLALAQAWPPRTWRSLSERALYQAQKLQGFAARSGGKLRLLRNRDDLVELLAARRRGEQVVGALLGTEGSHALDGELANIDRLYDAGYRQMGLQHFFDNRLGGSLHGESGTGLSGFGRRAVTRMWERDIVIDLAHSSEQVVRDVLDLRASLVRNDKSLAAPLLISHTGFQGHCPTPRNISDELMLALTKAGAIIGVGFWDAAVCDPSPAGIASAINYGIDLVGVEHVALGSDYDGSVTTSLDSSELAAITGALLTSGLDEASVGQVMGGNAIAFYQRHLPAGGIDSPTDQRDTSPAASSKDQP